MARSYTHDGVTSEGGQPSALAVGQSTMPSHTAAKPVSPVYWGDRRLVLYEGVVPVSYGQRSVAYDGAVTFDWAPRPSVSWLGSSDQQSTVQTVFDHWSSNNSVASVVLTPDLPANPRRRGAVATPPMTGMVTDSGDCDGLEFGGRTGVCDEVKFNLINFCDLMPLDVLEQRGTEWSGRWVLGES